MFLPVKMQKKSILYGLRFDSIFLHLNGILNILNINNKLFEIIYDIRQEFPFFSQELATIKDNLFTNNKINPTVCGQGIEILRGRYENN